MRATLVEVYGLLIEVASLAAHRLEGARASVAAARGLSRWDSWSLDIADLKQEENRGALAALLKAPNNF